MRFLCRLRLYLDEKNRKHRSHQCWFLAIRLSVIGFKVHRAPSVDSSRAGLPIEYTVFEIVSVWYSDTAVHRCTVGFTSTSKYIGL